MSTEKTLSPSSLRGTSTLLCGAPGSGKTWALTTFLTAKEPNPVKDLFVIVTDPNGEESLLDAAHERGIDLAHLHYHYVAPASVGWSGMLDMAQKINMMSYKDLSELKSGIDKKGHQQFMALLKSLSNFTCDCCNREWGAVDEWDTSRALAIDSLSGINTMARDLAAGAKPALHQGEWGVAMQAEERLVAKLCSDMKCFFVLTAHIEKEMDETIGRPMFMAAALGRKLAPKLPKDFSDVVLAQRDGENRVWSTTAANVDLKTRSLPASDKLPPDFGQILATWQRRNAQTGTTKNVAPGATKENADV